MVALDKFVSHLTWKDSVFFLFVFPVSPLVTTSTDRSNLEQRQAKDPNIRRRLSLKPAVASW